MHIYAKSVMLHETLFFVSHKSECLWENKNVVAGLNTQMKTDNCCFNICNALPLSSYVEKK